MQLELARAEDAAPIARLSRDEIERGLEWLWRPPAIRRLIMRPETAVLCARCCMDGQHVVAGFGAMEFGIERAHLVLLAVAPRVRRRGVARRILCWLEKSATTAGTREITLEVRSGNRGAGKFYATLGYRRGDYLPGFYQGREAAYRMTKQLF